MLRLLGGSVLAAAVALRNWKRGLHDDEKESVAEE